MRDERRAPFCYQEHEALEALQNRYSGRELTTALAIYQSLTLAASKSWRNGGRDGFKQRRRVLAGMAGVKPSTFDRYRKAFEELGLVAVKGECGENGDEANTYTLLSPGVPLEDPGTAEATRGDLPTRARPDVGKKETRRPSENAPTWPAKVNRQPVTDEERQLADGILAAWNRTFDMRLEPSQHSGVKIIGRIREHPKLLVEAHEQVIRNEARRAWWKEKRPGVNVVYGHRDLFDGCLRRAAEEREKQIGAKPLTDEEVFERSERELGRAG